MTTIHYNTDILEEYVSKIQYVRGEGIADTSKPTEPVQCGPNFVDAMLGCARWSLDIKDDKYGHVSLVDMMPRLVPTSSLATGPDYAIVQAARVSYGHGTKKLSEDTGLIRYLMRHRHTTPFEMVEFKFHCKMPIFVARQWIRHRTASVNEYSARYSVLQDQFYIPQALHHQSTINNQGADQDRVHMNADEFLHCMEDTVQQAYKKYEEMVEQGVSREQARIVLPVNIYTEWYWKIDLHNLLHFLSLRCDTHAQKEIQMYSLAMMAIVKQLLPITMQAFIDYRMNGVYLSRLEVDSLRSKSIDLVGSTNKREQKEWFDKVVDVLKLDWAVEAKTQREEKAKEVKAIDESAATQPGAVDQDGMLTKK